MGNRVYVSMFADGYGGECYEFASCGENGHGRYIGSASSRPPEACCYHAFGGDKQVDYLAMRLQECDSTGLIQAFECVAQ
jgi:hypothetical protein